MFKVGDRVVSKHDTSEQHIMIIDKITTAGGTWPNHCKSEIGGGFAGAWDTKDLVHAKPLVREMKAMDISSELASFRDTIKTTNLSNRTKELLLRLIELNT